MIATMPYQFVDAPGMVQIKTVAGVKSPVEVVAEILRVPQGPCRSLPGRRSGGRGDHRAGLFRRCPAPGHQGCRQSRRRQRPAPAQRAHRRRHRLRPGQRLRRHLRGVRPGRRHLRHLHPQAHQGACSRCWPPTAIPPWAATISTAACIAGSWSRPISTCRRPRQDPAHGPRPGGQGSASPMHAEAQITAVLTSGEVVDLTLSEAEVQRNDRQPGQQDPGAHPQGLARRRPAGRTSRAW
jgi:hypothetical protein